MRDAPAVVLSDGDESSGLATMLAELLEANLRDFRGRRRVATLVRGDVVLTAADRAMSVTLSFGPDVIAVRDGAEPGAAEVAAPWLSMARVCSGTVSPFTAWRAGELEVHRLRGTPIIAGASFVLSVPRSFYDAADGVSGTGRRWSSPRTQAALVVVAAAVLGGGVVLWRRRARRIVRR